MGEATEEPLAGLADHHRALTLLPTLQDIRSGFHAFAFSWDAEWLRWYVNETVIYEEPIRSRGSVADAGNTVGDREEGSLVLEFAFASALSARDDSLVDEDSVAATLQIERVHLKQGDEEDRACLPRHQASANCRKKTGA